MVSGQENAIRLDVWGLQQVPWIDALLGGMRGDWQVTCEWHQNVVDRIVILCSFAIQLWSSIAIQLDWGRLQPDCLESAIPPQSPGLQKIVPALPGFRVDRTPIPDRLRMDADSGGNWRCFLAICGFPAILVQSFQSPGNPLRFRNLTAIQFDCEDGGLDCRPYIFGVQNWAALLLIPLWGRPLLHAIRAVLMQPYQSNCNLL